MKKIILSVLAFFIAISFADAQFEGFQQWYPVGEDADIQYKTSYVKQETILFEANPFVRYSFYNDMLEVIGDKYNERTKKHAQAYYIAFKPQFRMYVDSSLPVRTPTYKVQAGTQQLFKLSESKFLSVALESGHFSNGQDGSSFSALYTDGSRQGDSMYTLITPKTNLSDILNRRSGNFSTNITELNFNYRINHLPADAARNIPDWVQSVTLGFVLYHDKLLGLFDIGGYSENDIKIYGRMRYQAGYEATHVFLHKGPVKPFREDPRLSFSEKIEIIQGAHPSVNRFRSETRIIFAPGGRLSKDFGIFAGLIVGHDNYNYRFVDSGTQFNIGLTWCVSPPPYIGRRSDGVIIHPHSEPKDEEDNTLPPPTIISR